MAVILIVLAVFVAAVLIGIFVFGNKNNLGPGQDNIGNGNANRDNNQDANSIEIVSFEYSPSSLTILGEIKYLN